MKSKLFYGWIVVLVTALVALYAAGARSSPGVFLLPMQDDLGWSKATLSFAVSIGLVMLGLGGPISGWLIDRYGPRRITLIGLLLTAVSFAVSSLTKTVWQLDLFWGFFSGLGTGLIGSVLGATVAARWFFARRGLVTGIFGASMSAGQLIFVPLLSVLVAQVGWRDSSLIIGGLAVVMLLPTLFFMKDEPQDVGVVPLGANPGQEVPRNRPDATVMGRAIRSLDFWLLCATFFVCGATSNGIIGTHFIAHQHDHGVNAGVAAGYLALMGAFNFVGTIASGWLTDRFDPRKLLCLYYIFRGASLFLLPYVDSTFGIAVFAVLFGLDYIATVPPTTALVADRFGRANVGTVYGWVFCAHQVGAALAAWGGGMARDALGSYALAFIIAGAIALLGGLLSLGIRRVPQVLRA
ncbi:MFS transporter [Deinococcus cellulosilyticus]|uniref:MFS transporter n=1 Tax=Deinococcus cellulosilyticus (strain DSM 18568 / NBRC 106333 / KACC 11606 / 5516J-15) TaxID=1223518 RepID=A0A511N3Q1_DEIC1|nr:MFS transporter [Deinococcus cellulosilyticus]GEM47098.1 MFS transporter [Deinococcus cellulosilyticus NBRC 106333 = KACC 11606]